MGNNLIESLISRGSYVLACFFIDPKHPDLKYYDDKRRTHLSGYYENLLTDEEFKIYLKLKIAKELRYHIERGNLMYLKKQTSSKEIMEQAEPVTSLAVENLMKELDIKLEQQCLPVDLSQALMKVHRHIHEVPYSVEFFTDEMIASIVRAGELVFNAEIKVAKEKTAGSKAVKAVKVPIGKEDIKGLLDGLF